ncbi:restriction endonuclease subunit S [Pseudomonas sp. KNUC1026]|uniref:restriction endonuclease subunit S n=1 Tax=Pseudomonas sp. KNUC1026 TaxID=2893890 RepID=UPI001F254A60|nr:restriction endonuclease subunit S [Pseudomonas sp. KNUC1026]UFH48979.1 restriction endonuclease subunit S [Pseudomonas sp. KNUC1026]
MPTEADVTRHDWEEVLLDSIAKRGSGHTPDKKHPEYWGGPIKWISLQDSARLDSVYIEETSATITVEGIKNSSAVMHQKGTVVLSRDAGVGKSAIMAADMAVSQHFMAWTCGQRLDNHFLYYWLQSKKPEFERIANGNTIKTIGLPYFKVLAIPLPPLEEQKYIASAMSGIDTLISSLDQLIVKKHDIQQATMQLLLTGQRRLPGLSGEWEAKRLGEVAKIQRGASPRPIDSPQWFDKGSTVGWVRISDVTSSGMYLESTTQRLSSAGVAHSRPVENGSLIMSICATVGRPVITKIDVCIHDGFVVFDNLQADKCFIYYVLKWIEPGWSKHGQTGSQMNLNTGLVSSTLIKLPPIEEQAAIATILSDMDTELAALEARCDKARQLKQGMMQELLTGRIRLVG